MNMLKVRIKDKTTRRFNDKATVVTITGSLPMFLGDSVIKWHALPNDVDKWIASLANIEISEDWASCHLILKVQGKAVKADEDKDNPSLAEKIAESRAKLKLFKFLDKFIEKLMKAYQKQLYGDSRLMAYSVPDPNCLYASKCKYARAVSKEKWHLQKLLEEA